jgi:hypothetical protein
MYSELGTMAYTKISDGGALMSVLPGLRTKLYLGTDHLLLIEQFILVERYKRFYFRDIQAITHSNSSRWVVFSVIWGVCALVSALILFFHHPVALAIGSIFTLLFGFAFFQTIAQGPTCIVRLQTGAQSYRIAPLERVRIFRKGMETIEPRIRNAQEASFANPGPRL